MGAIPISQKLDCVLRYLETKKPMFINSKEILTECAKEMGDLFFDFSDVMYLLSFNEMVKCSWDKNSNPNDPWRLWYTIHPNGSILLDSGGYSKQNIDKAEMDKLNKEKLIVDLDRKSTRLNSSHVSESRMPSSA